MSFIVPLMAFGAFAAAIPVIIHLFNRTRYRIVKWGAMHLLDSVVRVNRRRVRIEQLVLLLIRMALPAALALFMAKPVLTGFKALPGDVKRSLAIALDTSYSMEAGAGEQSSFARAKREADALLGGLMRGSDAVLVPMAGTLPEALTVPTVNIAACKTGVAGLRGGFGAADVAGAFDAALARIPDLRNADRELVVLSDFQRVSWAESSSYAALAERIRALPVRPYITLFRVGAEHKENVCVESLAFSKLVIGVGAKVHVKAALRNFGERRYAGLRVKCRLDGRDHEAAEIALGPGERSQVMFMANFDAAGSHYVEVATEGDPLGADNTLCAAVQVWDAIPVLLASGELGAEPLRGETDYLEVALAPFMAGNTPLADLLRTKTVDVRELGAQTLSSYKVVVLANTGRLPAEALEALADFVRTGGGLLWFPGAATDTGWANTELVREGLLPAQIGGQAGSPDAREQQTTIVGDRFDHEALALFNLPENGTIAGAEIRQWLAFQVAKEAAGVNVLARLATGDPFLLESACGEGRVIACATACDADWSNLPARATFVPLMQQLVTYLASTVYPPRNVEVGKALVAFVPAAKAGLKLTVVCPDGAERRIDVVLKGTRGVATFTATERPGLYVMTGEGLSPMHFVVSTSREESDLALLSADELARIGAALQADVVGSGQEYDALQTTRRHGREIWRWFFWGAVALLFGELLIEQFFARRKA